MIFFRILVLILGLFELSSDLQASTGRVAKSFKPLVEGVLTSTTFGQSKASLAPKIIAANQGVSGFSTGGHPLTYAPNFQQKGAGYFGSLHQVPGPTAPVYSSAKSSGSSLMAMNKPLAFDVLGDVLTPVRTAPNLTGNSFNRVGFGGGFKNMSFADQMKFAEPIKPTSSKTSQPVSSEIVSGKKSFSFGNAEQASTMKIQSSPQNRVNFFNPLSNAPLGKIDPGFQLAQFKKSSPDISRALRLVSDSTNSSMQVGQKLSTPVLLEKQARLESSPAILSENIMTVVPRGRASGGGFMPYEKGFALGEISPQLRDWKLEQPLEKQLREFIPGERSLSLGNTELSGRVVQRKIQNEQDIIVRNSSKGQAEQSLQAPITVSAKQVSSMMSQLSPVERGNLVDILLQVPEGKPLIIDRSFQQLPPLEISASNVSFVLSMMRNQSGNVAQAGQKSLTEGAFKGIEVVDTPTVALRESAMVASPSDRFVEKFIPREDIVSIREILPRAYDGQLEHMVLERPLMQPGRRRPSTKSTLDQAGRSLEKEKEMQSREDSVQAPQDNLKNRPSDKEVSFDKDVEKLELNRGQERLDTDVASLRRINSEKDFFEKDVFRDRFVTTTNLAQAKQSVSSFAKMRAFLIKIKDNMLTALRIKSRSLTQEQSLAIDRALNGAAKKLVDQGDISPSSFSQVMTDLLQIILDILSLKFLRT